MRVSWNKPVTPKSFNFSDLNIGDGFRLINGQAIYTKVALNKAIGYSANSNKQNVYGMLEIATGTIFAPSSSDSPVIPVAVEVHVAASRPSIY